MSDALELLKTRRSVKPLEMTGPGPNADEISTLLTIASRVPDHGKLAPWRFIVFAGDARLKAGDKLAPVFKTIRADATPEQVEFERQRFARAPLVIAVISRAGQHAKVPVWEQELSAGASCMNLVTAAHAMGYVACWLTEWFAFDRAAMTALGLAENERFAGFVYIGKATRAPEDRPRPALDSIVTYY